MANKDFPWVALGVGGGLLALLFAPRKVSAAMSVNDRVPPPPSGPVPVAANLYKDPQYPPNDPRTVMLLQSATRFVGAPVEWASAYSSWHRLIEKESMGWVGRPNYHFGSLATIANRDRWPEVWAAIRSGTWRDLVLPQYRDKPSSATGLGQLTISNIATGKYYPSNANGIGNALEEAIGMLKYIIGRYKTPEAALAFHDKNNWY